MKIRNVDRVSSDRQREMIPLRIFIREFHLDCEVMRLQATLGASVRLEIKLSYDEIRWITVTSRRLLISSRVLPLDHRTNPKS